MFILDLEINLTVKNNIDVSLSPAAAFVYNFWFEIVYWLVTPLILLWEHVKYRGRYKTL